MNKEKIIDIFTSELDDRDYSYYTSYVSEIVNTSIKNKSDLIEMFRNHPNWIEEDLMIRFDADYSREFNTKEIRRFADWFIEVAGLHLERDSHEMKVATMTYHFMCECIKNQFFDETMDSRIAEMNSLNSNFCLRNNMKSSKAINKIFHEMGWDKKEFAGTYTKHDGTIGNMYEQKYAMLCDNINPIKVKRHTVISLNPIDYLLMSNGTSWKSCHYIGDDSSDAGCYSSGTISYMLDNTSFVFYTVDSEWDGEDICQAKKIQRQIFGYDDQVFVQSRLYPQSMDSGCEHIYTEIRAIVQKVIADCLCLPNLWIKSKENVNDIVEKGDGATCYPDWEDGKPGSTHCSISRLKMRPKERVMPTIILGAKPICISCGNKHSYDESISCCESGDVCCSCGSRVDREELYYVESDGNLYCSECCFYCEKCDCYEPNEKSKEVYHYSYRLGWISEYWCEDCANRNAYECNDCGKYYKSIDDMRDFCDSDELVCEDCAEQYERCYECGILIQDDNATCVNGDYYCETCAENADICECERCSSNFFKENMFHLWDNEDALFCEDCADLEKTCFECGCIVKENEAIEYEGYYYCPDCNPIEELVDENKEECIL